MQFDNLCQPQQYIKTEGLIPSLILAGTPVQYNVLMDPLTNAKQVKGNTLTLRCVSEL